MRRLSKSVFLLLSFLFCLSSAPAARAQTTSPQMIVNAQQGGFSYAYAPSIIYDQGRYHLFFCSQADPSLAPGSWDFVRYTYSDDGVSWSQPVIKLIANTSVDPATNKHRNYAACDPSVVYFHGYYYMFYSNAVQTGDDWIIIQTQVSVARSPTIDGEYLVYTVRGTWEKDPPDPKYIITPQQLRDSRPNGYGAGQQSVVPIGDTLYLWYGDDSDDPDIRATQNLVKSYLVKSQDPTNWDTSQRQRIDTDYAYSVDIKYDESSQQFVMARIGDIHTANTSLTYSTSTDGVHWTPYVEVVPPSVFPDFAHNLGIASDRTARLLPGPKLVAYGAPVNLATTDTYGAWDLYASFTQDIPSLSLLPPTLTTNTISLSTGSSLSFSFDQVTSPHDKDWVGLYPQNQPDHTQFVQKAWVYTSSCSSTPSTARSSGTCSLTIPTNLSPGTYQLRLFPNDGFSLLITSPNFTITAPTPGDLNGDGRVDLADYNMLVTGFGNPYTLADYNQLVAHFGT